MGKAEEIISSVKSLPLQEMLKGVYDDNVSFGDKKLLERIIEAMSIVDRRIFVGSNPRNIENAYADGVLDIGDGQTISQPITVARMLLYADLKKGDSVLEVGAGSGWNASLIAYLIYSGSITSIDRIAIKKAEENLSKFKNYLQNKNQFKNLERISKLNFLEENIFSEGKAWKRKYDKIIITAGIPNYDKNIASKVESLAINLLNKNGILICPHTEGSIVIYRKNAKLEREERGSYRFIPLIEK